MFQKILVIVSVILIGYIGYTFGSLILKKYYWTDNFKVGPQPQPILQPVVTQPIPEPPRILSPSGPNPPNAVAPTNEVVRIPEEGPRDPYDETESQVPIKDNMRNPERSFNTGVDNSGINRSVSAGTASNAVSASLSSFSPEFAQNGGEFMKGILANDMGAGDEYATI